MKVRRRARRGCRRTRRTVEISSRSSWSGAPASMMPAGRPTSCPAAGRAANDIPGRVGEVVALGDRAYHLSSMCGRLTIHSPPDLIAQRFGVAEPLPDLGSHYNAAPLQQLPVVRLNPETRQRTLSLLRWGLVPVWARDPAIGSRMLN